MRVIVLDEAYYTELEEGFLSDIANKARGFLNLAKDKSKSLILKAKSKLDFIRNYVTIYLDNFKKEFALELSNQGISDDNIQKILGDKKVIKGFDKVANSLEDKAMASKEIKNVQEASTAAIAYGTTAAVSSVPAIPMIQIMLQGGVTGAIGSMVLITYILQYVIPAMLVVTAVLGLKALTQDVLKKIAEKSAKTAMTKTNNMLKEIN